MVGNAIEIAEAFRVCDDKLNLIDWKGTSVEWHVDDVWKRPSLRMPAVTYCIWRKIMTISD
jgi:hypothetical protein